MCVTVKQRRKEMRLFDAHLLTLLLLLQLRAAETEQQLQACTDDVISYISRHIDVTYEVLANYDDERASSANKRFHGRFNLTNAGTTTFRRGNWQIYMSSLRRTQFDNDGTMLGNSGLKVRIVMRPSSLGGGRILRRTLSVCPSVRPSR